MSIEQNTSSEKDFREQLREAIARFDHVLPGQAPIKDFVHHNTLHGYQHLTFQEAVEAARKVTGIYGYLPEEQFRKYFSEGRVTRDDIESVLDEQESLNVDEVILDIDNCPITRKDLLIASMLYPLKPVTGSQLNWQIEELNALNAFQVDVDEASRKSLLSVTKSNESEAINQLWVACLEKLGLEHFILHPEELVDLNPDNAEKMLSELVSEEDQGDITSAVSRMVFKEADHLINELMGNIGKEQTLRGVLLSLTGKDVLEELRPGLIRHLSSYLDEGLAAWHHPDRDNGFYASWKQSASLDQTWNFENMSDLVEELDTLPDNALDTIQTELNLIGIPRTKWISYLERLALELPGWSGMFLWRNNNPEYAGLNVDMTDYLAVRLVLERLYAKRLCRDLWNIEPRQDLIRWYLRGHRHEFLVRYTLNNVRLPEYLATRAQRLIQQENVEENQWRHLAQMIWTWRQSPAAARQIGYSVYHSAWPLFRLCQHMAIPANTIRSLDNRQVDQIFEAMMMLTPDLSGFIWLQAYERHYREELFNALANNVNRGRWKERKTRPEAQVVYCMDDREEGIRRHVEELNPNIETLGAAGFFGVAINWRGIDDKQVTPLCPIVVTPSHEVQEVPAEDQRETKQKHDQRRSLRNRIKDIVFQESRRNLLTTALMTPVIALGALPVLLGKIFSPLKQGSISQGMKSRFDLRVNSRVHFLSDNDREATPENPRLGFTDTEQADRVQGFLRTIGLQKQFAPFVVMMGHGSISQNNPHLAAYDCGACSGRHGGPNARVFAAMANRPEVRTILKERGIEIPEDTWFMGAEHNTCDDAISWYDDDLIPDSLRSEFTRLKNDLDISTTLSAHERCRRFASAPNKPSPEKALKHVIGRSMDFSQARPELGHATNAAAVIGRRSVTQGAFFDRRVFLISYDPTQDPEGNVLEAILLAAGPVGAGINLEYYFSTVNNEQYGCGSKVTHNISGLFGIMDGTSSDLRTGLPRQMIEIHEAMRLQIVAEATTEVLTKIYLRQPPLQELIGNGWLLLNAIDPETGELTIFKPEKGFVAWDGKQTALPEVEKSPDWYRGHNQPLTPALIKKVEASNA